MTRGLSRRNEDSKKLIGLLENGLSNGAIDDSRFDEEFEPEGGFVSLFDNGSQLREKLCRGAAAARRSIVRGDRSRRSQKLLP